MLRAGLPGRRGVFAGFRAAGFSVDASAMMPNATLARAEVALPEPPPPSCISHGSLLSKVLNTRFIACLEKCSESARITGALSSRNCSGVNSLPKISSISSSRLRRSRVSSKTLWMVSMERRSWSSDQSSRSMVRRCSSSGSSENLPDVPGGGLGLGPGHMVQGLVDLFNLRRLELYQPGEGPGLGPRPVREADVEHLALMPLECLFPADLGLAQPGAVLRLPPLVFLLVSCHCWGGTR